MMTVLNFSLYLTTTLITSTKNPVKTSMVILMAALTMFLTMSTKMGSAWIPMIATLMFSGGILIMFMILSSLHPNETPKKNKMKLMILGITVILSTMTSSDSSMESSVEKNLKMFYINYSTSTSMTLLIMLYFLTFLMILKKKSTSMRLILC